MTGSPLVTVIAVCYNHSKFVIECLDSIRNQTYHHVQLIIMDDCSQDDSVGIIRDWIKRYGIECNFIAHQKNQGLCRTLNEALELAQGEYISIVATDDLWLPEKLAMQVEVLERLSSDVGVVYGDSWQITEEGELLPELLLKPYQERYGALPEGDIYSRLIEGDFIPALNPLTRRGCYDLVGQYDERLSYEDWDMWLRIAQKFKFSFLPQVVTKYRHVSNSMTRTIHEKRTIPRYRSDFLIFSKHVKNPSLSQNQRQRLKKRLIRDAEVLYELNAPDRVAFLWRAAYLTRSLRISIICCIAIFLPHYRLYCFQRQFFVWKKRLTKMARDI
ncbi:alpha-1,3-rhamnosyltransferase [Anaerolineales bacterium]|nr:alpha-1,3-rhamnosyltransferase [Anaerolineales bacterium]